MHRSRLALIFIALTVFVPLVVACGDDDSSKSTPDNATKAASPSAATSEQTAAGGSKSTATATAAASGLADLQKASKDLAAIDFKVTYETSIAGTADKATTGSMMMAHKGTKSVFVLDGAFGGPSTGKTTIIDDGTSTFICTEEGQKTCLKTKSTGGSAANPLLGLATAFRADNLVKAFSKEGFEVKSVAGQTIAGRSAKCYEAKGPTGSGTVCLDSKNGMLLLIDGSDIKNGKTTKTVFKAKEATDSPSDADFNPPYPVQELPGP